MKLAIITPFYNPCGYSRIRNNHFEFAQQFEAWGMRENLFTIELILDEDEGVGADMVYHGERPKHCLWQKETMINAAVSQLHTDYDAVAWIDGDIIFEDASWVKKLEAKLQTHRIVQLFEYADLLGPDRNPILHRKGVVACKHQGTNAQGAWGMAWAARRDAFVSLPWMFIAGGGDVYAAKAFMGMTLPSFGHASNLTREYKAWASQQKVRTMKEVSYVPQRIAHLFHGQRANRRYMYRDTLLQRHRFEPHKDVIRDAQNAFATNSWSHTESALSREVRTWFTQRKEDS